MSLLADLVIAAGLFFLAVSAIALLVLPDLYTRAHAVAKSETLGLMLVFVGALLRPELTLGESARLVLVMTFAMIANPTGVHALIRAARRSGAAPWTVVGQEIADAELREDGS